MGKNVKSNLAPHKNIPPRVAVNTNNRNSVIAIDTLEESFGSSNSSWKE